MFIFAFCLNTSYELLQAEVGDSSKEPRKVQESDQSSHADKESQGSSSEGRGSNTSQAKRWKKKQPLSQLHKHEVINFLVLIFCSFFRTTNVKDQPKESSNSKNKAGTATTRDSSQTRQSSQRNKEPGQQQTSAPQKPPTVFLDK